MTNLTEIPFDDGDNQPVVLPSGATFYVHSSEVDYFNERSTKYLSENHFTNISDFQDIDRLLMTELLIWRWQIFISKQSDYWGEGVDTNTLSRAVRDHSAELRNLKKTLGIDKETRDKAKSEDAPENYLANLRARAMEFGNMRNEQAVKAITLFKELDAKIGLESRTDEQEQKEQKCSKEDVWKWMVEEMIPEFNEIDEKFRATSQKYWIAKM